MAGRLWVQRIFERIFGPGTWRELRELFTFSENLTTIITQAAGPAPAAPTNLTVT